MVRFEAPVRPAAFRALVITIAVVVVAACGGGSAGASPGSPTASMPTDQPPTVAPTTAPTAQPTPETPSDTSPLTDAEIATLTGGRFVQIPIDAPSPKVDAAAAEATIRAVYTGERTTIEVRRIAMQVQDRVRTGWFVALTPMTGAPCTYHAGLLPRAIEGGIVDDQTGDQFYMFVCG